MKLILPLLVLALAGCASTEIKPFEGNQIVQGAGGTKESIEGIDVWTYGTPPRKYKILGVIEDDRPAGIGAAGRRNYDAAMKAKEYGADAVILDASETNTTGVIHTGTVNYGNRYAFGSGTSVPVRRMSARLIAIKYL